MRSRRRKQIHVVYKRRINRKYIKLYGTTGVLYYISETQNKNISRCKWSYRYSQSIKLICQK